MYKTYAKAQFVKIGFFSIIFGLFYFWLMPLYDVSDVNKNILSLDLMSSYSKLNVLKLFETIGARGQQQYLQFLIVDSFYIFIYCFLSMSLISILQIYMGRFGKLTYWLRYFPLAVGVLDIIENLNTYRLLKYYPIFNVEWVYFGSFFTHLKWYGAATLVGVIICFVFYVLLRNLFWRLQNLSNNKL